MNTDPHALPQPPNSTPYLPPEYVGFFECFNRGEFFEAHEVLEELWLDCRKSPIGDFYKALIQYAGVFVHLEHGRLAPAVGLLQRAHNLLSKYPSPHESLDVERLRADLRTWVARLETEGEQAQRDVLRTPPKIELLSP